MENGTQNKLISVIVPVYNVESFLDQCVTSIINQTYSNFELILVDDGSKDSSGAICDEWYKKDSRIKVIHQSNGGLSAARNSGLDQAKGDYVCFIDSDDFVKENYLEAFMITMSKTDADIAICDIISAKLAEPEKPLDSVIQFTAKECRAWLTNPIAREYVLMVVSWNKMYKRELFNELRFEKGKLHEDEFMINKLLRMVNKVTFVPVKSYVYRNNEESITGKNNNNDIRHLHGIDAYVERIKSALEDEDDDKEFAAITLKWALLKLADFYRNGNPSMQNAVKKKYDAIFNEYQWLLTDKQRLKYKVFTVTPGLFCKKFVKF
ncbi:glycosyltransferase family 2 protein [Pseudobutyrivibrio xylanivorans]|uniref:Glycosyltransferase involved in cell wall bisynthesis n=1 Tax=Pseudobutyrivibrio xylanivorans TaxID=185007 RepID=A0A1G5S213_PSEXY|nr:glycosyltransferase [Pseudobutyrivibrio xylanivorans]SCZ80177.1 Glycosyltransferase involved in cell wall bisynthesis [Pseudobutyrivibrio xylanivorans]